MLERIRIGALLCAFSLSASAADDPFHVEVSTTLIPSGGEAQMEIVVVVPAGFHVYRDMMRVSVPDSGAFEVGAAVFPAGRWEADPAVPDEIRELYDAPVSIQVPVKAPDSIPVGTYDMDVYVGYQGCKATLCYLPQERTLSTVYEVVDATAASEQPVQPDEVETMPDVTQAVSAEPERPPTADRRWCSVVPGGLSGALSLFGLVLVWRRRVAR